ncbi:hypothetical protein DH86_00000976 [Scytalidium sp. 3C]|nr:hypothetical protein DH86_00000976 [Scytalidium sp. 3C]
MPSPSPGRGSDVMDTDDTRESLDPESQPASEPGNQPLASANITTIDLDLQDGPSESETPTSASIAAEAHATKQVVDLKSKLREAPQHAFWEVLLEELCAVAQAQCGFVTERILASDDQGVVELPELGEPGSYLTGVGVYVAKSKNGAKEMLRGYRFPAYGTPCAHMKHDEVVVIPEGLDVTAPSNLPCLPWSKSEAFIGVPVFAEGRCVAHLGLIWTPEGAAARDLSWNFIEMIMHSLEDMIAPRIQARRSVPKPVRAPSPPVGPMPLAAIKASQSLKPYARSLSHELRTPMQGIVGMLDIMYSTVLDAIASDHHSRAQAVFKELKRHIEVVQDSSRRAVEAADNVIHAYDHDMQMPDTPLSINQDSDNMQFSSLFQLPSPGETIATESDISTTPGKRRDRDISEELDYHPGPPLKKMFTMTMPEGDLLTQPLAFEPTEEQRDMRREIGMNMDRTILGDSEADLSSSSSDRSPARTAVMMNTAPQRIVLRTFLRTVVDEALRSGHPSSEVSTETERGETIEVRTEGSRGEIQDRTIYLDLDPDVPEIIMAEEQHLQFALQKVVDNAIKFTDQGSITIKVNLSKNSQTVEIRVIDTGRGIPEASRSHLFHPHFQEDPSISRSKDGLGLSLFNAKAHIRKNLGGDVTLERSSTKGPSKGSQFLIRLPISSIDIDGMETPLVGSTPGTPIPATLPPRRPSPRMTPSSSIMRSISSSSSPYFPSESPPLITAVNKSKRQSFNPNLAKEYPMNFLIAEDNAINRNVAIGSLKKLGYSNDNITVAFDGVEAVRSYKASLSKPREAHFNGILMDIWMPNMDGYEAAEKIIDIGRENGEDTKVIAVTADITGRSAEKAREVGMHGFLAKPYKVNDIERMIIQHFSRSCTV